jgi:hypothetical protein
MIGHKLPNKTKSVTVAEPKLFHQLNNPEVVATDVYIRDEFLPATADSYTW